MKRYLLLALLLVIGFCSCKKENETKEDSTSLIGTWVSYNLDILNEAKNVESRIATSELTVTFTDTKATFKLSGENLYFDSGDGEYMSSITSSYSYYDDSETALVFDEAYSEYGYEIVAVFSNGSLTVRIGKRDWDEYYQYYCSKK